MTHRATFGLLIAVLSFVIAGTALAYWKATGTGAGTGAVGSLNQPSSVGASSTAGTGTVNVTWTASATTGGRPAPTGYYVRRWSGGLPAVAGGGCGTPAAPVNLTSCNDAGVADGTYTYTVVAVYHSWTAESSHSSSVTVINDATPPTSSITFPSNGSRYNASAWSAGCSPAGICGSASDSGTGATGVSQVQVSVQRGSDSRYWSSATSTWVVAQTWNTASGTTSWKLALAASNLTGDSYTVLSRAIDAAGNTQSPATASSFTYDTTAPTVTGVTSTLANGSYKAGQVVPVTVTFSESVTVTGTPQLTLALNPSNRAVSYSSGSGTATLTFNYTVQAGDTSTDLDYAATTSLALNSGTIRDAATNDATLTLPSPGASGSLGFSKNIVIDTTAPAVTITKVNGNTQTFPYSTNANLASIGGTCGSASGDVATISVTANGSATTPATTNCSSGTWQLTFSPAISAANSYVFVASQSDTAGNAGTATQTVVVDKTAPTISAVASQQSDGSTGNGKAEVGDKLILTFSENMASLPASFTGATEARQSNNPVTVAIPNAVAQSATGSSSYIASSGSKSFAFAGTYALNNNGASTTLTITITSIDTTNGSPGTASGTLVLVPGSALTDVAGNAVTANFTTGSTFKLF
jgi:hypothetical protein